MYLQTYKNKEKREYVRICDSWRDKTTGRTRTKIIETFGRVDKLLADDPDALIKLQKKVDQLNADKDTAKQFKVKQAVASFLESNTTVALPEQGCETVNYGVKGDYKNNCVNGMM